jgi:iron complex outermembrane recepter protein
MKLDTRACDRASHLLAGSHRPFIALRGGRLSLLASSVSLLLALPVRAQPQPGAEITDEIQVTGSRIERSGFTSPVPVTTVQIDQLQQFEPGAGLSQQLETLPQFFNNFRSDNIDNQVSANVGQSHINMRGMGVSRTLVLLDGSRVVPSDRQSSVSVDYLPTALIERVEIVTGGASAAYGADALAGVTNFILNRDFVGLDVDAQAGMNEYGDGENYRTSVTFGRDIGERAHVFGSVEVRRNPQYRRGTPEDPFAVDWDKRTGYVLNPEWSAWRAANPTAPATSAPVPQRLTRDYVHSTTFTSTGLILQPGFTYHMNQFDAGGTGVTPFVLGEYSSLPSFPAPPGFSVPGTLNSQSGDGPQYQQFRRSFPETFNRIGVDQKTAFVGFDYELTDSLNVWGHALVGEIESTGNRVSSLQGHTGLSQMTIFRENPYLPANVRQAMVTQNRTSIRVDRQGFFDSDIGSREQPVNTHSMGSLTIGVDAALNDTWSIGGKYQYGKAEKESSGRNWERYDRFYLALDAVTDPLTGSPICRIQLVARDFQRQGRNLEAELHAWALANTNISRSDALRNPDGTPSPIDYPISVDSIDNTISGCVPVNMFGTNNASDAALDYIFSDRHKDALSTQKQHFAEVLLSGTLGDGWGAGAIETVFGLTYRKEEIAQGTLDLAIDVLGPPKNATLAGAPFLINGVPTNVAIRGIPPGIDGGGDNLHRFSGLPTVAGHYDVRELFNETILPLLATGDRRIELNLAARYADYSRAGGIWVAKAGLDFQINEALRLRTTYSRDIREGSFAELFDYQGRGGAINDRRNNTSYTVFDITIGNPDIAAEEANTSVLGFVYEPTRVPGLQFSADYYNVDLTSAIAPEGFQAVFDRCFAIDPTLAACADEIALQPTTGDVSVIRNTYVNINAAKVAGWDFETSYSFEPDFLSRRAEAMSVRVLAGYLDELSESPLNRPTIDRAGSAITPDWTVTGIVSYNIGKLGLSLQQNWESDSKRNVEWIEGVDVDSNHVPSRSLTNLGLSWSQETTNGSAWRATLNVNNLFDRDPWGGTVATTASFTGVPRVGDELGRRYVLGFEYDFN